MDKNIKNSLLFGAVVGGLFAIIQNSGNKQKLTEGQLKDLNALTTSFTRLQDGLQGNTEFAPIYAEIKEKSQDKNYEGILVYIDYQIKQSHDTILLAGDLDAHIAHVLSSRFTADRANEKTHEVQSFFRPLEEFPLTIEALLKKRIDILKLIEKVFTYIKGGEATDFKPEDAKELQILVEQFKLLSKEASHGLTMLSGLNNVRNIN